MKKFTPVRASSYKRGAKPKKPAQAKPLKVKDAPAYGVGERETKSAQRYQPQQVSPGGPIANDNGTTTGRHGRT